MNPSNNAENYLGFEIRIEERVNQIRRNSRPLSIQDTPFIYLQPFRALIPCAADDVAVDVVVVVDDMDFFVRHFVAVSLFPHP